MFTEVPGPVTSIPENLIPGGGGVSRLTRAVPTPCCFQEKSYVTALFQFQNVSEEK